MFGESDSESPRVPSPWDSLTSTPPPGPTQVDILTKAIPRLVPEAEEGNVEYKLQLLSPSPARFTRLVTQLKWRLLEGGGQAYYELGVADSGALVGLPRQQLEESLETLEMMAGEIGASVIVVKEIEVPPELSGMEESQIEKWNGKRSARRKDLLRMIKHDSSPSTSTTEVETELSTPNDTDIEENTLSCSPPASPHSAAADTLRVPCTPSLPAIFTMDGDDDVADFADNESPDERTTDSVTTLSISLEIVSVYKPRPVRKRPTLIVSPPIHHNKRGHYTKKHKNAAPPSNSSDNIAADGTDHDYSNITCNTQHRRDKRVKIRESRANALLTHTPVRHSDKSLDDCTTLAPSPTAEATSLTSDLESFHVTVIESLGCVPLIHDRVERKQFDGEKRTVVTSQEPRLIVEVLVVRKLAVDEAYLDFEAFSLQ